MIFERGGYSPLNFIARLAALVPKSRVNLTRYHGVFAPNSPYRVTITPARRGKGATKANSATDPDDHTCMERRASMTWVQRLMRVFNVDIITCSHCQGPVKIIACIEDPVVIEKILSHLKNKAQSQAGLPLLPPARAPPLPGLFGEGTHLM